MNITCPNCGTPLVYDVETDQMKCSYYDQNTNRTGGNTPHINAAEQLSLHGQGTGTSHLSHQPGYPLKDQTFTQRRNAHVLSKLQTISGGLPMPQM